MYNKSISIIEKLKVSVWGLVYPSGHSVLLESRPDDIAIDMSQISQQNQRQQQLLDEQVKPVILVSPVTPLTPHRISTYKKEQKPWRTLSQQLLNLVWSSNS